MKGFVSLVGVGPGDPGLLTLRGKRAIERADTVMHDALIHPLVLRHARPDAEVLYVGKRKGMDSVTQDEINHTLLLRAAQGRRVARLKGGDPLLFARGAEEALFLSEHGVPFEIIAGVTSALGASAYAGIPLSHRELSSSVALVTATERPDKAGAGFDAAALSLGADTAVFYMGLHQLDALTERLVAHGRSPETPAAVIQWGTSAEQRVITSPLRDLHRRATEAGITSPALIIVGETVRLREKLRWFDRGPLFGLRVLVTRPRAQSGGMVEALVERGAIPVEMPAIAFAPPTDPEPLARAIDALRARAYDAVAFTSANGVERFFAALAARSLDARAFGDARVVAIGPATAEALQSRGIRADAVPREFIGEAVADAVVGLLGPSLDGRSVLLARAEVAREALPEKLRALGATVDVVAAYRTVPASGETVEELRNSLRAGHIDVVTFTASSTVESLCDALGPEATSLLSAVTICTIGPVTSRAARARALEVHVEATEYTADGMLRALAAYYAQRGPIESPSTRDETSP